ncbi:MAG: DNRLRE domain-containing protein [Chloroflexi bacterium]|nr:DNRLRE domain-containing protein [Chloroflexota bacterium]
MIQRVRTVSTRVRILLLALILVLGLAACQHAPWGPSPLRPRITTTPTPPPVQVQGVAPTAIPMLYARDDYRAYDYARHHPEYGPVGLWIRVRWNQLHKDWSSHPHAFDWEPIDTLLEKAARQRVRLPDGRQIPRPVILSVSIYSQRGSSPFQFATHTPGYLRRAVGDLTIGDERWCAPQPAPPYANTTYREELKAFIRALGQRYDQHPLVTAVMVGPGYDEETAATRLGVWCGRKLYSDYLYEQLGGSQVYASFVLEMMKAYREAFPHTALYLQAGNAEWSHRGLFVEEAAKLNPPMGYKPNGLAAISGSAYGWKGTLKGNGWMQLAEAYEDLIPIAFEPKVIPAYFEDDEAAVEELYWMLLWGLSHNADFFDLQSNLTHPALDWFHLLPKVEEAPNGFPEFITFVNRNLGREPATAEDVWIVLRDVEPAEDKYGIGPWGPRNGYVGGEEGDWDHWLYRIPVYEDATTRLLRRELPGRPQAVQARQLRRTDGRYMWFQVDSRWQHFDRPSLEAGGTGQYRVTVWYLDVGKDAWALEYTRDDGSVEQRRVQKEDTREMRRVTWTLRDARWQHGLEGADLRINALDDGPEYIHMVHIQAIGPGKNPPTPALTPEVEPAPLEEQTWTEGVDGYNGMADTFISRWFRRRPMAKMGYTAVRHQTLYTLIRADVSQVPPEAQVEQATLSLWAGAGSVPVTLEVYKLLRAWEEGEATWYEAAKGDPWDVPGVLGGQDVSERPVHQVRVARPYRWVDIDITDLVQEWVRHPEENFGILITGKEPGVEYHFLPKEFPLAKFRPHLHVNYRVPTH